MKGELNPERNKVPSRKRIVYLKKDINVPGTFIPAGTSSMYADQLVFTYRDKDTGIESAWFSIPKVLKQYPDWFGIKYVTKEQAKKIGKGYIFHAAFNK